MEPRTKTNRFDADVEDRVKLLQSNPELYYQQYPRPTFGFRGREDENRKSGR